MDVSESAERLRMMSESLTGAGIDALVFYGREINHPSHLLYQLLGGLSWEHAVIVRYGSTRKPLVIAAKHDAGNIPREYFDVVEYNFDDDPAAIAAKHMSGMMNVGLATSQDISALDATTYGMFKKISEAARLEGVRIDPFAGERVLYSAFARRTSREIEGLRRAVHATDELFGDAQRRILGLGVSEREIYEWFAKELQRRGLETSWSPSSCPIVAVGQNSARAHHTYGDDVVEIGKTLFLDFGVMDPETKMPSDLQRCYFFPDPDNDNETRRVLDMFELQKKSREAGTAMMVPGSTGLAVDKAGRDVITGAGYEAFSHAFGHSLSTGNAHGIGPIAGPNVPRYGDRPLKNLEAGMVLTAEPSVFDPEKRQGRISVEDDVLITKTGPVVLNTSQENLYVYNPGC